MAGERQTSYTLGRAQRLQHGWEFRRVRECGGRVVRGCLIANWMRRLAPGKYSRVGVISTRRLGGAVERNRARRLLRESFRLNQHRLSFPIDLVLVARKSIRGKSCEAVSRDLVRALKEAELIRPR